jgi:hypothetical protein
MTKQGALHSTAKTAGGEELLFKASIWIPAISLRKVK